MSQKLVDGHLKTKEFRCPVHGYISLPEKYVTYFVDTPIFQRLKHIQQSSMRVLYPSAHHDRFCHSLGVFHLGQLAYKNIASNASELFPNDESELIRLKESFQIACLLHDCAHAPFSHTFEKEYDPKQTGADGVQSDDTLLDIILKTEVGTDEFNSDYDSLPAVGEPAAHEKASAIIVLKKYKEKISSCKGDPELVVRMIIGCSYRKSGADKHRVENALVQLLNSDTIDVDKLDYIIRDTWASGVNNVSIDIDRLLASVTIAKDARKREVIAFKKSALSVLRSVLEGRNHLYRWIYSHHKVAYCEYLLQESVRQLARAISSDDPEKFLRTLFSVDALCSPQEFGPYKIYLPTDGDIEFLLKQHDITEYNELVSRKKMKALWKSFAEYEMVFRPIGAKDREIIQTGAKDVLTAFWDEKGLDAEKLLIVPVSPKIASFRKGNILIVFDDDDKNWPYIDVFFKERDQDDDSIKFFYLYGPEEMVSYKDDIVDKLARSV